jgi:hypothetical protein
MMPTARELDDIVRRRRAALEVRIAREARNAKIAEVVAVVRAWYVWMTAYPADELDGLEEQFAAAYVAEHEA